MSAPAIRRCSTTRCGTRSRGITGSSPNRSGAAARYHPDVSVFTALADDTDAAWRDLATLVGDGVGALFRPDPPPITRRLVDPGGGRRGHQMLLARPRRRSTYPSASAPGAADVGRDAGAGGAHPPRPVRGPHGGASAGTSACTTGTRSWRWPDSAWRHRGSGRSARCARTPTSAVGASPPDSPAWSRERIIERGEEPFLHHAADNDPARAASTRRSASSSAREVTWRVLTRE